VKPPASNWNSCGSTWNRWDPHIHTPGTLYNDNFGDDWEGYLTAIEQSEPSIKALGVTDYYSLGAYRMVRNQKEAGRLPGVECIFPNIEVRLDVNTAKGKAINLHLLFCPDDQDHEKQIERVFGLLTFEYKQTPYFCTREGLIGLGRKFDPRHVDDRAAFREGAKQVKIEYRSLREAFRRDKWLRENCLIAVAAGQGDGMSGLQGDDSFAATREEIQRLAHIVFSSKTVDRDYWLGLKEGEPREAIEKNYGSLKPCLHGSDAHSVPEVGKPFDNRYCWIKGDLAFETLRQAAIEPAERVHVAEESPMAPAPSMTLDSIRPYGMPWLKNASIPINSGLVAVIGARGSGKTALVDLIAAGAGALADPLSDSSFLKRATDPDDLIGAGQVEVCWADGRHPKVAFAPPSQFVFEEAAPEVCYLSQQFVERLCSSSGLAVSLREEIERVIFDQTEQTEKLNTTRFADLWAVLVEPIRHRRKQHTETIAGLSKKIADELRLIDQLAELKKTHKKHQDALVKLNEDLKKLIPKGKENRAKKLFALEQACIDVETKVETVNKRIKTLDDLLAETAIEVDFNEPERFAQLQERFADAALSPEAWAAFRQQYKGDVAGSVADAKAEAVTLKQRLQQGETGKVIDKETVAYGLWPLDLLVAERNAIKKEVGVDQELQRRYDLLKKAIATTTTDEKKAAANVTNSEGAEARRKELMKTRRDSYRDLIATIVDEQAVLAKLYAPLHEEFAEAKGSLSRLRFSVKRVVAFDDWIKAGEELLDLRKASAFQGHGRLAAETRKTLLLAWQTGDAEAVATAINEFLAKFGNELLKAAPNEDGGAGLIEWRRKIGNWLYSSDHLSIEYGLEYDGTNIEQLSPGTRGIVLLLLYLAIDRHDRRPLLIDQPEENLDPRSVFDDLVPHFREARRRRQVVIVTHNANLVVNTDADQVIVASSKPSQAGQLPNIEYTMGSLENPKIRKAVCEILEGGERAFLERERRYRLQWEQMLEDTPAVSTPEARREVIHFGYGSNMKKAQMAERCPGQKPLGRASLPDYRWLINRRGVATVRMSKGDVVEGFLFELTADDVERLDRAEGVAGGSYAKHEVEVRMADKTVKALVYIDPIVEEGKPSEEYAARVNEGVADAGLPIEYIDKYIRPFVKA
jgi:predicted ATPase